MTWRFREDEGGRGQRPGGGTSARGVCVWGGGSACVDVGQSAPRDAESYSSDRSSTFNAAAHDAHISHLRVHVHALRANKAVE